MNRRRSTLRGLPLPAPVSAPGPASRGVRESGRYSIVLNRRDDSPPPNIVLNTVPALRRAILEADADAEHARLSGDIRRASQKAKEAFQLRRALYRIEKHCGTEAAE